MKGIGVDIIEISRIEEAIKKRGARFLKRVYSDGEIEYCSDKIDPYPSYAARFAAKEAYIKYAGGLKGISVRDIEVVNDAAGKPHINVKGRRVESIFLSLSHSRENAVAVVAGD